MKQRLVIGLALILLLAVVGYMVVDLFVGPGDRNGNPFDLKLTELRQANSPIPAYREARLIPVGLPEAYGLAVDGEDRIYVSGAGGVECFSPEGEKLKRFTFQDTATCLAVAPDGQVILGMGYYVAVMDPDGQIASRWKAESGRSILTSLATNGPDVFVADAGERIVYRYDRNGRLINRIGEKDTLAGIPGLVIPSPYFDVSIGRDDEVWVVNPGRHLLEAFRPDGSLISTWGTSSVSVEGFCGCCNPSHVAMLPGGSFVTSEKGIERVKVYSPTGTFLCLVAGPDQFDEGTRGVDLAVDSKERILLLDPWRNQVRIFIRKEQQNEP